MIEEKIGIFYRLLLKGATIKLGKRRNIEN